MRSINIIILIIMKNKNVYPWIVVALLWVVALLNYMDRQMLSTMQEAMKVDIVELNKAEAFGALMAVFLWIYGFMSPIAGMIADRVNRKWLVVGSLFVWSGVTYLMGYADNFHELYWLRAVMGVSEALYIPSALSLIADWHQGKSRSLAIGVHMTGLYVGQAIGGFGATVAAIFSWHTTFPLVWYRRNDIFCGSDIFVEGEPRSYDCGTAVFCGGQRKEAVAVWRVEHVVLYLGILDYPLLFCGAQSSGMGHKELASHSFL